MAQTEVSTLFERLGGEKGLRKIVDDIIDRHFVNPVIKVRFEVMKDRESVAQHVYEFFAAGTGGPVEYTGRDMVTVHRGMNISEQEFLSTLDDVMDALRANNIGEREQQEVLAALYNLKSEVIRV